MPPAAKKTTSAKPADEPEVTPEVVEEEESSGLDLFQEKVITTLSIDVDGTKYEGAVVLEDADKKAMGALAREWDKAKAAVEEAQKVATAASETLVAKLLEVGLEEVKTARKPRGSGAAKDTTDSKIRKYAERVGLPVAPRGIVPGNIKTAYANAKAAGKLQDDEL